MSKLFNGLRILISCLVALSIILMFWFSIVGAFLVSFFYYSAGAPAVNWVKFGADMTSAFQAPIWTWLSSLYSVLVIFISVWFAVKTSISAFFPNVNLEKVFDDFLYRAKKHSNQDRALNVQNT